MIVGWETIELKLKALLSLSFFLFANLRLFYSIMLVFFDANKGKKVVKKPLKKIGRNLLQIPIFVARPPNIARKQSYPLHSSDVAVDLK